MNSIQSIDAAASSFAHQLFTPFVSELTKKVALVAIVAFSVIFVIAVVTLYNRVQRLSHEKKLLPFKQDLQQAQKQQQEAASNLKIAKETLEKLQKGEPESDAEFARLKQSCDEAKKREDETCQVYIQPDTNKDYERLLIAKKALQEAEAKAKEITDAAWEVRQAKIKAAEEVYQSFRDKELEISGVIWDKDEADLFEDEDKKTYTQAAKNEDRENYIKALKELENAELKFKEEMTAAQEEWSQKIKEVDEKDLKTPREHARKMEKTFQFWAEAKKQWNQASEEHKVAKAAYEKYKEEAVAKAQQEVDRAQQDLTAANAELKRSKEAAKTANHGIEVKV